jgi:hypothetical protein
MIEILRGGEMWCLERLGVGSLGIAECGTL